MLREQFRLVILLLFTNSLLSQSQGQEILFVGHAFGSHKIIDNKIDPNLKIFLEKEYNSLFNKIVLGGDFIYDCISDIEYLNFVDLLNKYDINFVVGNHENCNRILSLSYEKYGDTNFYEKINNKLLIYLNTSIEKDNIEFDQLGYIVNLVNKESPKEVLIFTHQLIYSKSDFNIRVNSRKYYEYGNNLFDKIFEEFYGGEITFHFFAGDIGAFSYTPYAFHDSDKNFKYYATGIGNKNNNKGILINIDNQININFVDLDSSKREPLIKYNKSAVQLYQLPKLILFHIKDNFIFILTFFLLIVMYIGYRKIN